MCDHLRPNATTGVVTKKKKATVALFAVDFQIADVAAHLVAFVKLLLSNLWVYVHIHVEMS